METIHCPACQAPYRIALDNLGKQVRCQKCGDVFIAQSGSSEPPMIAELDRRKRVADEIEYQIFGDDMQYAEVVLDPREAVIAEAGGMMYMTSGIQMETVFTP